MYIFAGENPSAMRELELFYVCSFCPKPEIDSLEAGRRVRPEPNLRESTLTVDHLQKMVRHRLRSEALPTFVLHPVDNHRYDPSAPLVKVIEELTNEYNGSAETLPLRIQLVHEVGYSPECLPQLYDSKVSSPIEIQTSSPPQSSSSNLGYNRHSDSDESDGTQTLIPVEHLHTEMKDMKRRRQRRSNQARAVLYDDQSLD